MISTLISVVVLLLVVGVALYLISLVPMDGRIRMAVNAVVILIVVLWLLRILGFVSLR